MRALITGASSGIGRDIARELSKRGHDLIIVARNVEALNKLKAELKTDVKVIQKDLSSVEKCKELYEEVQGQVDILINNAGFGDCGEFWNTDLEKELGMIDLNIKAVQVLTKLFLKDMMKKNSGHILNVASIAGFMPGPLMATYYSSKAYIVNLSRAIQKELKEKKSNVKLSVLCPGPVKTNFNNVANVKFSIKPLSSEYVAKYSVEKMLKNKKVIIPGTFTKILRVLAKISPTSVGMYFVYKNQKRKNNN